LVLVLLAGRTPLLRVGEKLETSDAEEGARFLFREFALGPTRSWLARKEQ
jgi:hypothetical protein